MFVVGERIEPTDEASERYGATCKPDMLEGLVLAIRGSGEIEVEVTKGKSYLVGETFYVDSRFFRALAPLTAEQAFEQLVHGQLNDAQYMQALKKIKNT